MAPTIRGPSNPQQPRLTKLYAEECAEVLRESLAALAEADASNAAFQSGLPVSSRERALPRTSGIRGGARGAAADFSSSSDEENDGKRSGGDSGSRSGEWDESSSSDEGGTEQRPAAQTVPEPKGAPAPAGGSGTTRGGKKKKKARGAKKWDRSDDIRKQLGSPPSVLLPLGDGNEESGLLPRVVDLPAALLPPRSDLNDLASACRSYLALSENLAPKGRGRAVVVLLLRSGRFAGGIFRGDECLVHRACQRYTVRRGQGGSQSANDNSKGKAKSMGAQLRRAGEQNLRGDVAETLSAWRPQIDEADLILLSCPKTMRKGLHEEGDTESFLPRNDGRIRRVPLDVGRPSFESVKAVHDVMMQVSVRSLTPEELEAAPGGGGDERVLAEATSNGSAGPEAKPKPIEEFPETKPATPLTELHEAAAAADLPRLTELLQRASAADEVDSRRGEHESTPLHCASASSPVDPTSAAACLSALLLEGHANPCVVDARGRVPYFVASHDKVRDAFRLARGSLGEDYCPWDDGAKVGPPLSEDDLKARKEKAAEKKRRQRARQKEKKAREKAEAAEEERRKKEAEEKQQREEDAKRVRDGLKPKASKATNMCDFCQKVCKGKKRSQMFNRLDYVYCSTDCVKRHQRELAAAAAVSRLQG